MGRAGRRLEKGGIHIGKVLDLEHLSSCGIVSKMCWDTAVIPTRVDTVLGKTAVHRHTMGLEVLAEQLLATAAVKAFPTQLRVICNNAVADCEALDL